MDIFTRIGNIIYLMYIVKKLAWLNLKRHLIFASCVILVFSSFLQNYVPHVSTDINIVDFGKCQNLRVVEDQVLNLTNHTKGKITVQWIGGMEFIFLKPDM